jgi:hypothetical protein
LELLYPDGETFAASKMAIKYTFVSGKGVYKKADVTVTGCYRQKCR